MSRYDSHRLLDNALFYYKKQLDARNTRLIQHYRPNTKISLSEEFLDSRLYYQEVWQQQTKLYKLSEKYYGTTEHWWIIGLVNYKPTDVEWANGDLIRVPVDINEIINYINTNFGGV